MATDYHRGSGTHGGARQSTQVALAAVALSLGPPSVVAFLSMIVAIASDHTRLWRTYAKSSALCALGVVVEVTILVGNPMAQFASGYVAWWSHPTLSPVAFVLACLPATPIGATCGAFLGALFFGATESTVTDHEWHPIDKRRRDTVRGLVWNDARRAHADREAQQRCPAPPLAAWLDGDLTTWRRGDYMVTPQHLAPLGLAVVGAPGAGKTETMLRLLQSLLGWQRRIVMFLDGKATDAQLAVRTVGLIGSGRCLVFPSESINGWIGDSGALFQRLYGTQESTEPYYDAVMQTVLRLGCDALAETNTRSSVELLKLLSFDELTKGRSRRAGAGTADLRNERAGVFGVQVRMEALMRAVAGGLDGTASYGDQDVLFARLPWTAHADVVGLLKFMLEDFSHWCGDPSRKAREGAPVTLVIDELSAVPELVPKVIELVERGRDVDVQVVVSAQSYQGLGADDDERDRLLSALAGGIVLHRCDNPEPFCERAGTVRVAELSQQLVETVNGDRGSLRMAHHMKVKPDDVRAGEVGEVWVISSGRFAHGLVIRSDSDMTRGAELVEDSVMRGEAQRRRLTEQKPQNVGVEVTADDDVPGWLDDL